MSSDRLVELLRQRAALQQQLAQLDHQIAEAGAEAMASSLGGSPSPAHRTVTPSHSTATVSDPDALIGQYASDPRTVSTDVRKGCLLYAGIALALLLLGLAVLLHFYKR